MSSFSIFPSEILECITSVVPTSQQMRLWQCGDRTLNIKLKNGGLKRTSLLWSRSCWMPWPHWYFTTFDSLQHVEWGVVIGTSLCPTLEFNLLPKTLKHLHLSCSDVFLVLIRQNVHMNELLPMLHTLHLCGNRLCEENLKNLPSNLIELRVDSVGEKIESSTIFGDLPRTIQRLTLTFDIVDRSEHANSLPSELVSVDFFSLDCNFNWFSKLPMSLKSLKIYCANLNPEWSTLPSQLEELKIENKTIGTESVLQLPPSLKTLELSGMCDMTFEDELISLLPKNLTRLRLLTGVLPHSVLQRLPATLNNFEVRISASHPDVVSLFHPQSTRIHLGLGRFSDKLNKLPFPNKLQYLRIHSINDAICAMLPPGLQALRFHGGLITTEGASKLPKSLSSLIGQMKVFYNNDSMSYLGHISEIQLMANDAPLGKLNPNWLSSLLPASSSLNRDCVSGCIDLYHNNHHLTSLKLFGVEGPYVQIPFFNCLQKFKNLNTLHIWGCGSVSSDWLCLVPGNVTHLRVRFLSTIPTANQLSKLPRYLRHLDLGIQGGNNLECDWTDENLQSLPRSLHKFWIDVAAFPILTQRMYEYIPPNLQESSLKYQKEDSFIYFIQPLDRLHRGKSPTPRIEFNCN